MYIVFENSVHGCVSLYLKDTDLTITRVLTAPLHIQNTCRYIVYYTCPNYRTLYMAKSFKWDPQNMELCVLRVFGYVNLLSFL